MRNALNDEIVHIAEISKHNGDPVFEMP